MHREDGSVLLSPFDERAEGGSDTAEIDSDALPGGDQDRGMAQGRHTPLFDDRRSVAAAIEVDLDDLQPVLRIGVARCPAHETGRDGGECEDVLSAFAVARSAKMR